MFSSYRIRGLEIKPNLVLSPMSGVTHSPFRQLIKELNPGAVGLVVSEFISVEGLTRDSRRSREMLGFEPQERPYGIQIFGYDIDRMRDAAIMVEEAGADLVDINCGCPAPKVVKRGGGCELMRQPEHLAKILREVRRAVSIPLTVKIRAGWDEGSRNAVEIARLAEGEGVEALTVHGRTRVQLYRGEADWDLVSEVAQSVGIPVCGSGDVVDAISASERLKSGAVGLYIGRASLANPFIFSDLVYGVGAVRKDPMDVLERYLELLLGRFSPKGCIGKIKQLASQMCRGYPWAKDICRAVTLDEQRAVFKRVREHDYRRADPPGIWQ